MPQASAWARLQSRLPRAWGAPGKRTVVVCPSLSLSLPELERLEVTPEWEERLLCRVLDLVDPLVHVIFLGSRPPSRESVDHYLDLLMCAGAWDARDRLHLLSARPEEGPRPLSRRVLQDADLVARVRSLAKGTAWLDVYRFTEDERSLAMALGLPVLGSDPSHARFGTKSGARRLFRELGVPCPAGFEGVRSRREVAEAARALGSRRAVVKLDEGFSGRGNAVLEGGRLRTQDAARHPEEFLEKLERTGGIVEELVEGCRCSPSVQLLLAPDGEVRLLSTHEQVLEGHLYRGCRMPAAAPHRPLLHEYGLRVGRRLLEEGVLGHLSVDFVAPPSGGLLALEINLRKGGTTHPLHTLRRLTGGHYDAERGEFLAEDGGRRCYTATDKLPAPGGDPGRVREVLVRRGLRFDPRQGRGVVLHMLGAVPSMGMVGATCVDVTRGGADRLFDAAGAAVRCDREAAVARPLPRWREIWSRRLAWL